MAISISARPAEAKGGNRNKDEHRACKLQHPVMVTMSATFGIPGGIMAIKSGLRFPQWAEAVSRNRTATANLSEITQSFIYSQPAKPSVQKQKKRNQHGYKRNHDLHQPSVYL